MDGWQRTPQEGRRQGGARFQILRILGSHWDGDNTLVIDTTGVDDRTWLDDAGHPHSVDMHVQERYTRLDQYNMQLTITIDDPTIYTKPFEFLKTT